MKQIQKGTKVIIDSQYDFNNEKIGIVTDLFASGLYEVEFYSEKYNQFQYSSYYRESELKIVGE